jgi:PhnB protein
MQSNPHLTFPGTCEEAFKFYAEVTGGTIDVLMPHAGTPDEAHMSKDWASKIIHGRLSIGGSLIMGADAPPERYSTPQGFTLSLRTDTPEEAERVFAALSQGGAVQMPMEPTFFAHRFGIVTDRYATPWMVLCEIKM